MLVMVCNIEVIDYRATIIFPTIWTSVIFSKDCGGYTILRGQVLLIIFPEVDD